MGTTNGNEARPQRGALSEAQARELAKSDRHYVARQNGSGEWIVWDSVSDHRVEFNEVPPAAHFSEYVLLQAIELIDRSGAAEHDVDAENVMAALQMMVAQRGCEHLGASDGKLTTVMDLVIHG